MAIRDLKAVIYTADDGTQYQTAIDSTVFAQNTTGTRFVGGADYAGTPLLPPLPRQIVPRHVAVSAAGDKRKVVILSTDGLLWTGDETAINLPVLGAAAVSYTVTKKVSEHDKRRFRDPAG